MSAQRPAVSVIIPVYNTEDYVAECLDSVLEQEFADLEILCVDDGSTDRTPEVLAEYERTDDRVRVLRNEVPSRGPGAGRNLALVKATGEFVAFVDSDDRIRPRMIAELYQAATDDNADVAMCCLRKFDQDGVYRSACTYDRHIPAELDAVAFTWADLGARLFDLRFASCNKLYRRDFLLERDIRYAEDAYYEDLLFTFRCMLEAERLRFVRRYHYLNRKQREGATTFDQGDRVHDALVAMDDLEKLLATNDAFRRLAEPFAAFKFRKLRNYLYRNDVQHIQPFYAALQAHAQQGILDDNPYLGPAERRERDRIRRQNLFEFLVDEHWALQAERKQLKPDLKRQRRRSKRLAQDVRRLEDEVDRQAAAQARLERELEAAHRPWWQRAHPGMVRIAKALLGSRGTRAVRSLLRR